MLGDVEDEAIKLGTSRASLYLLEVVVKWLSDRRVLIPLLNMVDLKRRNQSDEET